MNPQVEASAKDPEPPRSGAVGLPPEPDYAQEIPAGRPGLSGFLTLVLCLSLGWAFSRWRLFDPPHASELQRVQQASLLLRPEAPPTYAPEPRGKIGPAGGSNRRGTGSIDPALLSQEAERVVIRPPEQLAEVPPVDVATSLRESATLTTLLPASFTLDRSLPIRPGGNGAFRGDGKGFGRGHGDGVGDGSGGGAPGFIRLLSSVQPDYRKAGQVAPRDGDLVTVELKVDARGVALSAVPLSGRASLYPVVLKAALRWRFEIPPEYAHLAPYRIVIEFAHQEGPRAMRTTRELSPVVLR